MRTLELVRSLTRRQRASVMASFLGWMLDAFDFFLLVFVLKGIAHDFGTQVKDIAFAITLTLAMRPVGALFFGWLADRYGRRPVLMLDILLYSVFELASAFAPDLGTFLVLRALFGFAMGGEWGVGASLAMESIPAEARGVVSGFLQQGYACGYLLASLSYWLFFPALGWRGLFVLGIVPALLVVYIRRHVEESPIWGKRPHDYRAMAASVIQNWKLFLYLILLMACFNAFSHGTQDLYPTFLQSQRNLDPSRVSFLAIIANVGAIAGGIICGAWSERIGRGRMIAFAAICAIFAVYPWVFASSMLGLAFGAFVMQFMVQGAWGCVPAHLNELSPQAVRGIVPGLSYQLGNLAVSLMAPYQAALAQQHDGNYALVLAGTAIAVALLLAGVIKVGPERRGMALE